MLVVIKVKGLENLPINDIEAGKEVMIQGVARSLYFVDNYIDIIESKANKYDELIEEGKVDALHFDLEEALSRINKDLEFKKNRKFEEFQD